MMNTGRIGASIVAVVLTLVACSGPPGAPASPPQGIVGVSHVRAQTKSVLYVSAMEGTGVYGYQLPDRQPSCTHPIDTQSLNYAIATDQAGNLWIPRLFQHGVDVAWYAPDCGSVGGTLSVPSGYAPEAIAFGADGTKYVLNAGGSGSVVSLYSGGSTSPTGELSDPRLNTRAFAIGIDSNQNVYVSCCDDKKRNHRHGIYLIIFRAGGRTDRGNRLNLAQFGIPGGSILFDRAGNMIAPDQKYATVNVYAPPYTGSPTVYPLKGIPYECALDPSQTTLACATGEPFFSRPRSGHRRVVPGGNTADVYAYPSLRFKYSLRNRFGKDYQVIGVSFAPPSQQ